MRAAIASIASVMAGDGRGHARVGLVHQLDDLTRGEPVDLAVARIALLGGQLR
jgi:hypothetical protein